MPVDVTESALRDALAMLGEWNSETAALARTAIEVIGWEGSGDFHLRHYDVAFFVWYTLPRKFISELDEKRSIAESLGRLLEQLGGRAARYAETCRSAETHDLLRAWENEEPSARTTFRRLLDRSGLEPPDTAMLAWGSIMGLTEAQAREQVITELERAIEAEQLTPGARGFSRRQGQIVEVALQAPTDEGRSGSRLEAIRAERLETWLAHGPSGRSPTRRRILEAISTQLDVLRPAPNGPAAEAAAAPAIWLLERGLEGIALTQTHALNRALVREAAARWPGWWDTDLHGPPHQEADLILLCQLDDQLRSLNLLRRRGRRLLTTTRGKALIDKPADVLTVLTDDLLAGNDFHAACIELAVALLLAGFHADWSDPLAEAIRPAIVESSWHSENGPPDARAISWEIADFIRSATACGLLQLRERSFLDREPLRLTEAGRPALIAAVYKRATAPRHDV